MNNKYEEALSKLLGVDLAYYFANEETQPLLQLVKRATPMKPTYEEHDYMTYDNGDNIDNQPSMTIKVYKCPSCKETVGSQFNYCQDCGQYLDWSDEE